MTVAQKVEEDVELAIRLLRAKRKRLGLSLADVGRMIGVHRNTIHRWESRTGKPPLPKFMEWKREIERRMAERRDAKAGPEVAR